MKKGRRNRRAPPRPRRKVIYVGCEGDSEQAYVALLQDLINERGLAVTLRADVLNPGAGDPEALVRKAIQRIHQHDYPKGRIILLDRDDRGQQDPQKAESIRQRAQKLAQKEGIFLLWQIPNHEGFLLHHLPGCENENPSTAADAERRLRQKWPEYQKPMDRKSLAKRIGWDGVRRAAERHPCLRRLLAEIGLV